MGVDKPEKPTQNQNEERTEEEEEVSEPDMSGVDEGADTGAQVMHEGRSRVRTT